MQRLSVRCTFRTPSTPDASKQISVSEMSFARRSSAASVSRRRVVWKIIAAGQAVQWSSRSATNPVVCRLDTTMSDWSLVLATWRIRSNRMKQHRLDGRKSLLISRTSEMSRLHGI
jgi:anti-sigma-K factor RskA